MNWFGRLRGLVAPIRVRSRRSSGDPRKDMIRAGREIRPRNALELAEATSGVWAIRPGLAEAMVAEAARRLRLKGTKAGFGDEWMEEGADEGPPSSPVLAIIDDVAHVFMDGVLTNRDASCARLMGFRMTSTVELMNALQCAVADQNVATICLHIDSPGGSVAGIPELGAAVREAGGYKPVIAMVSCQCCSAAYWVASQASAICAEPSAMIGSIGVYTVIEDSSKAFEAEGIKVHLLRSGPNKGAGEAGVPVDDDQLASVQRTVDDAASMFTAAVAAGRELGLDQVLGIATGESWFSARALELGLIDEIVSASVAPDEDDYAAQKPGSPDVENAAPSSPESEPPQLPRHHQKPRSPNRADQEENSEGGEEKMARRNVLDLLAGKSSKQMQPAPGKTGTDADMDSDSEAEGGADSEADAEADAEAEAEADADAAADADAEAEAEADAAKSGRMKSGGADGYLKPNKNSEARARRGQEQLSAMRLQAENEMLRAALAETQGSERKKVIDRHVKAGRVTPAMRAGIEKSSKAFGSDLRALDEFLSSLPVQVRPTPKGDNPAAEFATRGTPRAGLSAEQREANDFIRKFKLGDLAASNAVDSVDLADGGKFLDANGNEVPSVLGPRKAV
jgi:signal peptide peptidase SppA